jgi:hypothetical protein
MNELFNTVIQLFEVLYFIKKLGASISISISKDGCKALPKIVSKNILDINNESIELNDRKITMDY